MLLECDVSILHFAILQTKLYIFSLRFGKHTLCSNSTSSQPNINHLYFIEILSYPAVTSVHIYIAPKLNYSIVVDSYVIPNRANLAAIVLIPLLFYSIP